MMSLRIIGSLKTVASPGWLKQLASKVEQQKPEWKMKWIGEWAGANRRASLACLGAGFFGRQILIGQEGDCTPRRPVELDEPNLVTAFVVAMRKPLRFKRVTGFSAHRDSPRLN